MISKKHLTQQSKQFCSIKRNVIKFSEQSIESFRYIFGRNWKKLTDFGKIFCGVPMFFSQHRTFFGFWYANDTPEAVKVKFTVVCWWLISYVPTYSHCKIEKILNKDFCECFVDNELCIHFGDGKTKSVFLVSKQRAKNIRELNIRYKEANIKQQVQVTYLGCVLDESMSGELIKLKITNKIHWKPKSYYGKNIFLIPDFRKMLCKALIQLHFY